MNPTEDVAEIAARLTEINEEKAALLDRRNIAICDLRAAGKSSAEVAAAVGSGMTEENVNVIVSRQKELQKGNPNV